MAKQQNRALEFAEGGLKNLNYASSTYFSVTFLNKILILNTTRAARKEFRWPAFTYVHAGMPERPNGVDSSGVLNECCEANS